MKKHGTRKAIDSTVGLVRHRTVVQEQKARKTKEEGESAGAGVYMHKSEIVKRQVLYNVG